MIKILHKRCLWCLWQISSLGSVAFAVAFVLALIKSKVAQSKVMMGKEVSLIKVVGLHSIFGVFGLRVQANKNWVGTDGGYCGPFYMFCLEVHLGLWYCYLWAHPLASTMFNKSFVHLRSWPYNKLLAQIFPRMPVIANKPISYRSKLTFWNKLSCFRVARLLGDVWKIYVMK